MPSPSATDVVTTETHAERRRLAGLLDQATPDQWAHPSLCTGWRVREVVAHMTLPYRHSGFRVLRGMIAARGRFNVFADRIARHDTSTLGDTELLRSLQHNIEHPWRPPGGGELGALSHDVIHGLDITEPLGWPRPPVERLQLVLGGTSPRQLTYFGVDLTGVRLVASDCDLRIGTGREVVLEAADILLIVTGRRPIEG